MKLVVLGIVIGSIFMWTYTNVSFFQSAPPIKPIEKTKNVLADFKAENETIEEDGDEVEAKIDEIKDQVNPDDDLSEECSSGQEKKALLKRLACNRRTNKARRYWSNLEEAEKAVLKLFSAENAAELMAYTECNAIDITWYEMHCEVDRQDIGAGNFKILFEQLKSEDLSVADGRWLRRKPNLRKILNPRWVERSRLVIRGFKLNSPWQSEPHPTENEVVILLEQKLGGKVYIVGLPVTGVGDDN